LSGFSRVDYLSGKPQTEIENTISATCEKTYEYTVLGNLSKEKGQLFATLDPISDILSLKNSTA
jgi:hypothetical protein